MYGIELVDVQGAWLTRYDEALECNRHAQAAIERLGERTEHRLRPVRAWIEREHVIP